MPNTDVFSGSCYSSKSYGGIGVDGKGDTAFITFTDKERNEKEAEIKVYTLSNLKKNAIFKNASVDPESEFLFNTWFCKRSEKAIIKYASEKQLAFVFSSDQDIDDEFKKALDCYFFYSVEYFKEAEFCNILNQKLAINITQLRAIAGMSNSRIEYYVNHSSKFADLLDLGFSISQLGAMKSVRIELLSDKCYQIKELLNLGITIEQLELVGLARLKKYFDMSYRINSILEFISIQQVMGLDHAPLASNKAFIPGNQRHISLPYFGSGTMGEFSYESDNNNIKIVHTDRNTSIKTNFNLEFGNPTEDSIAKLKSSIKNKKKLELVHNWYLILKATNETKGELTISYCPELNYLVKETSGELFPEEGLKKDYLPLLVGARFYEEIRFDDFLIEKGCPIDQFRKLPGMSQSKLELLCNHYSTMTKIVDKGINIEKFALIDEARLSHIIINYHQAEKALEFVDIFELLDLNNTTPRQALSFFNRKAIDKQEAELSKDSRKSCVVM